MVMVRSCLVILETGLLPIKIHQLVANVDIKAHVPNKDRPVLFVLNRVCLLEDPTKNKSLAIPLNFLAHGVKCCMRPPEYGGSCGLHVANKYFPFQQDIEKIYFNIKQPSEDDLMNLEWFELMSPHPELAH
jgi:hypothetical protein